MPPFDLGSMTKPLLPNDPSILHHPTIPNGAFGLNPRSVLGKEWWDVTRKAAEAANNGCCYACGIHKSDTEEHWLEGHECYDINYAERSIRYLRTVSLCSWCHSFIHAGYTLVRATKGEMSYGKYLDIIEHGVAVLESANLYPTGSQVYCMTLMYNHMITSPAKARLQNTIEKVMNQSVKDSVPKEWGKLITWTLSIEDKVYTMENILNTSKEENTH